MIIKNLNESEVRKSLKSNPFQLSRMSVVASMNLPKILIPYISEAVEMMNKKSLDTETTVYFPYTKDNTFFKVEYFFTNFSQNI